MEQRRFSRERREFLAYGLECSAKVACASLVLNWTTGCTREEEAQVQRPETTQEPAAPQPSPEAGQPAETMSPAKAKEILANDPTAQNLNYVELAEESEAREALGPEGETRYCCNCQFFAEQAQQQLVSGQCPEPDARAACQLIPAAPVRAGGYCTSWVAVQGA